jgi:triacylglycerol lipase
MLARLLQAWLLAQAAGVIGVAWYLAAFGMSFGHAVLFGSATLIVIHGSLFILRLAVAWRHIAARPEDPRVGWFRVLGGAVSEWFALAALYCLLMPFERWWMGKEAQSLRPRRGQPIIVLMHGYLCNRGFWWWLRRHLQRASMSVATITLEPPFGDIEAFAEQLDRCLCGLPGAGEASLMLVGHSMGGLVARAYLRRHGPGRVAKLITLGTPHHGSRSARLGPGVDARQMEPDSPWLATLNEAGRPPVPTLCLWSTHDAVVFPQSSACLRGEREMVLPALGHLSMGFSPRVLAVLENEAADLAVAAVSDA